LLTTLKNANLALSFLLEIAALVALGYWGFHAGNTLMVQVALGIGAPAVMVVVWGIFLAPTSKRRLPNPARLVLMVVIFGAAAAALVLAGLPVLAVVLDILVVLNLVLSYLWQQQ
jgi:hypothetical protein